VKNYIDFPAKEVSSAIAALRTKHCSVNIKVYHVALEFLYALNHEKVQEMEFELHTFLTSA
jgi:hypothetical protein